MKNKNRLLTTVICLVFVTVLQARNIKLPLSLLNINVPQLLNEQNTDNLFVPENAVNQSDRKIKGTIMDESGDPIIGANVMVKGTAEGTITDLDGKFFMSVPDKAVLVISYVGYIKQEVKVTDQSSLRIILIEDTKILDEVVIVGYGVQKKLR